MCVAPSTLRQGRTKRCCKGKRPLLNASIEQVLSPSACVCMPSPYLESSRLPNLVWHLQNVAAGIVTCGYVCAYGLIICMIVSAYDKYVAPDYLDLPWSKADVGLPPMLVLPVLWRCAVSCSVSLMSRVNAMSGALEVLWSVCTTSWTSKAMGPVRQSLAQQAS